MIQSLIEVVDMVDLVIRVLSKGTPNFVIHSQMVNKTIDFA